MTWTSTMLLHLIALTALRHGHALDSHALRHEQAVPVELHGAVIHGISKKLTEEIDGEEPKTWHVEMFYDIQYATAKRFEKPVMVTEYKSRPVPITEPKKFCRQQDFGGGNGIEECLYLDVYRPRPENEDTQNKLLPVMVYIHAGALMVGAKHKSNFKEGLQVFTGEGVIVVAINYRVNVYGFWTNPEDPKQGLWGLKDQIKALKWVQKNINSFGGDPDSVTIVGRSAGGLSVTALYASPKAKGLFHRAIAMSPGLQYPGQYQRPAEEAAKSLSARCTNWAGCGTAEDDWAKVKAEYSDEEMYPKTKDKIRACMQEKDLKIKTHWIHGFNPWHYDAHPPCEFDVTASMRGKEDKLGNARFFNGYDGKYLKQGLFKATCNAESATGSDVPIMIGSLKYEWYFFDPLEGEKFGYVKNDIIMGVLDSRVHGFKDADEPARQCVVDKMTKMYEEDSNVNQIKVTKTRPSAVLSQLLTDALFTIGPQLLSVAKGATKYRYVMDTGGTGRFPYTEDKDSAHADDLCYFHLPDQEQWYGAQGGFLFGVYYADLAGKGGCHATANPKAAKIFRQYWTTFIKEGKPSSTVAAKLEVEEWKPVNTAKEGIKNPKDMLGLPYMSLNLGLPYKTGKGSKMIDDIPWTGPKTAELLAKISCSDISSSDTNHKVSMSDFPECPTTPNTNPPERFAEEQQSLTP